MQSTLCQFECYLSIYNFDHLLQYTSEADTNRNHRIGHFPVKKHDKDYVTELKREAELHMPPCRCSNYDPDGCERLFNYLRYLRECDFDEAVLHGVRTDVTVPPALCLKQDQKNSSQKGIADHLRHCATPCPPKDPARSLSGLLTLAGILKLQFQDLFNTTFSTHSDIDAEDLLTDDHLWLICKNYQRLLEGLSLDSILGSEPLDGAYQLIISCIDWWKKSKSYTEHCLDSEKMQRVVDEVRLQQIEKEAQKRAAAQRRADEVLQKEERDIVRLEARETKRLQEVAEKERKRLWWDEQLRVLDDFKAAQYSNPNSVSTTYRIIRYPPPLLRSQFLSQGDNLHRGCSLILLGQCVLQVHYKGPDGNPN